MFYIQLVPRGWNKSSSWGKSKPSNSQPLESELRTNKSSKFASQKTQEYIQNARLSYIYERGILF
ncbi:MAG: hypothetical protein HC903_30620 [Methylacidiphilales bacterium]|nr:hypothetical protein [Candidatus Methylacidiphilales bacterium]NJR17040.1 hypothetical protein [Calothrix sp. CSU_2_0]